MSDLDLMRITYHNEGLIYLFKKGPQYILRKIVKDSPATFNGWGMKTTLTNPPWHEGVDGNDEVSLKFLSTHTKFLELIEEGKFWLTQFGGDPHKPGNNLNNIIIQADELRWRHYIVFWSVIYAAKNTLQIENNLVECGVCDGMGAYFSMSACKSIDLNFKYYLYDSFQEMKDEFLDESEKSHSGAYSYLNIDTTIKNLWEFRENTVFNKGYIPESFETSENPDSLIWLHIDLNSSLPTIKTLEFFFDKLAKGGIILFDDYGWIGYQDAKKNIDSWINNKPGLMFSLPTGQAIFFKL